MSRLSEELVFLILQFCKEEKLTETAHMLERETALFFDMSYFEALVLSGKWDEVEKYLSGYGSLEDSRFLLKVYFEVRKQKFFEALDMGDRAKALEIVRKELKVFASNNEELFKEITQLLTLDDFREHELLSAYGDIHSARSILSKELRRIIEADPLFHGKLKFPTIGMARLRRLINQSLNWQHLGCSNPKLLPDIKTLFEDHLCEQDGQSVGSRLEPSETEATTVYCSWSPDPHPANHSADPTDCSDKSGVTSSAIEDSPETEDAAVHEEVDWPPLSKLVDLPNTIGCILNENSSPTTMDFHPVRDFILLVGTDIGDIAMWDIFLRKKLYSKSFNVWDIGACTKAFKAAFVKDPHVSVNRAIWSPDGGLIGVAYSKHIVQLYTYQGGNDILPSLEIDAHVGSVNNIAFAKPDKENFVITCGEDKIVKVWDALTGENRFVFEDHGAAVTCVCPREIRGVDFIFSSSVNGEMRGWVYDNLGYRIGFNDPCCRRMICTKDGKRILTCGINEEDKSCILEWDYEERSVKRTYHGLTKRFPGVVHFDTAKDQILAAGDDHEVKFWNLNNSELVSSTKAGGGLPVYPYIRFDKEGKFLAVSAKENRILILATPRDLKLLKPRRNYLTTRGLELFVQPSTNSCTIGSAVADADSGCFQGEDGRLSEVSNSVTNGEDHSSDKGLQLTEVDQHPELNTRWLSAVVKGGKICRLLYTHAGNSILALTSNGVHLVWKWPGSDMMSEDNKEKSPQVGRLEKESLMTNLLGPNPHSIVPCSAVTKNDAYLISASGREVSLFNILTFKRLTSFMPEQPPTAVAIYPKDNNVIAIGREDSMVVIYNVQLNEIRCKLAGHSGRITDLAFSTTLNKLISCGADAKIIAWETDRWEEQGRTYLPILSGARIQFHPDQAHFLAIQETVLAIYKATELKCEKQWFVGKNCAPISHAAISCDGKMIYACFYDAIISIFDASNFQLKTRITPSTYLPAEYIRPDMSIVEVRPLAIACHPQKASQFALGLQNGKVVICEPSQPNCDC